VSDPVGTTRKVMVSSEDGKFQIVEVSRINPTNMQRTHTASFVFDGNESNPNIFGFLLQLRTVALLEQLLAALGRQQ